jgi:hypothetical protein
MTRAVGSAWSSQGYLRLLIYAVFFFFSTANKGTKYIIKKSTYTNAPAFRIHFSTSSCLNSSGNPVTYTVRFTSGPVAAYKMFIQMKCLISKKVVMQLTKKKTLHSSLIKCGEYHLLLLENAGGERHVGLFELRLVDPLLGTRDFHTNLATCAKPTNSRRRKKNDDFSNQIKIKNENTRMEIG